MKTAALVFLTMLLILIPSHIVESGKIQVEEVKEEVVTVKKDVTRKTVVQKRPIRSEIEELICQAFGDECDMAIAIARAESGLRPDAVGDTALSYMVDGVEYGKSYGLYQIRHLEGRPDPSILLDPVKNVEYAKKLYERSGWYPWSVFTNKSYERFL